MIVSRRVPKDGGGPRVREVIAGERPNNSSVIFGNVIGWETRTMIS